MVRYDKRALDKTAFSSKRPTIVQCWEEGVIWRNSREYGILGKGSIFYTPGKSMIRGFGGGLLSRPARFFFGKTPQTPQWTLGQNLTGHQFLATSEVVWPRVWGSECPQIRLSPTRPGTFRALDTWANIVRIQWKLVWTHLLAKGSP